MREDGSPQAGAGTRAAPHVENGSAGIAPAAHQVLRHREDALIAERLPFLPFPEGGDVAQRGLVSGREAGVESPASEVIAALP
ncbi:hypothetical protein [Nonomuraea typhae]|uniref:hypothetical protein n=1 Tax=Nonomuraea typhae TaxID=2603600 RepID=UPI0012FA5A9C|nr:hypothetical protein [Nonomuraea typhae]